MSHLLHRLGRTTAAHPWRTISAWVLVTVAVFALAGSIGGTPQDNWDIPNARAQVGIDQLREHTPGAGNASARVVVHTPDRSAVGPAVIDPLTQRLEKMPHAVSVSSPRFSEDRDTALLTVEYDAPVTNPDLYENLAPLNKAVAPTRDAGIQVELGGDLPDTAAAPMRGSGELIGIVAALLILVLAFGSVVSAGLPIAVALTGLAVGSAGITLLAATMDVSTAAPMVATMVGLGVGIDYALLLVTRFAEFLRAGHDKVEAAGRAVATAGRSVVFASATVLVSLLGLKLAGLPTYDAFGYATAIAVVGVASAALTLVPALCGLAGRRLLPRKVRAERSARRERRETRGLARPTREGVVGSTSSEENAARVRVARRAAERDRSGRAWVRKARAEKGSPLMERWATRVGRRPLAWALLATVVMLSLAAPALSMRTWPQDSSAQPSDLTTRKAYDLVAHEFGPGANGPITYVTQGLSEADVTALAKRVAARDDIAAVSPVVPSTDGVLRIFEAEPTFGPTDERTPGLVGDLRATAPAGVEITGTTPLFADIAELFSTRLWVVVGFVVAVSMLLLGMVFRSVVVPVKAAVMNLLSISAAFGVMTAIFQWGWGSGLLGLDHAMPVSSWMPILLFAVLFGLSMDYEVFLLSRIREDWLDTGDAHGSVVRGLSATGRVISAAAAIMVAVFLGFASEVDAVVKQLGVGMAVAIALDATLVRMVLVPATMTMLGRWNWWMPAWLDRILPTVRAEVSDLADAQPTTEPSSGPTRTPVGV